MLDLNFYKNKNVLVTGHTGFKGTWLSKILIDAGANVTGYSLVQPAPPTLFEITGIEQSMNSVIGDIRDFESLKKVFYETQPEIVFHLAAQAIVKEGYREPRQTYETNIMGTVNVLECVRISDSVKSVLNVTTDKVYENKEWEWGYRENEPLDGYDPYSNSKSCSELVTHSYNNSFFKGTKIAVSTARAGNVIGGGDYAKDRIIPDCIRAAIKKETIKVRNPYSIRPYQHVLEALNAYLMIAARQFNEKSLYAGYYNVGPDEKDCCSTKKIVELFLKNWQEGITWEDVSENGPHEANFLKLDCSKLKKNFEWQPRWDIEEAVEKTVELAKCIVKGGDIIGCMEYQIHDFFNTQVGKIDV